MSFFNFKKKKEEKKTAPCACGCCRAASKTSKTAADCRAEKSGIYKIAVLGAGCKSCHEMYENAKRAANNVGLSIEVEYITDMQKITEYGVMTLPALVVNEKVVSMGKVLKSADIEKHL